MYINIFHQSFKIWIFTQKKKYTVIVVSFRHLFTDSPIKGRNLQDNTRGSHRSARLKRERESRKRWIFREKKDESKMKFQRLAYKRVARLSTLSQQYQQRMDTPIGVRKLGLAGGSSGNAMTSAWRAAVCLRINALKENLRW